MNNIEDKITPYQATPLIHEIDSDIDEENDDSPLTLVGHQEQGYDDDDYSSDSDDESDDKDKDDDFMMVLIQECPMTCWIHNRR